MVISRGLESNNLIFQNKHPAPCVHQRLDGLETGNTPTSNPAAKKCVGLLCDLVVN